MGKYEVIAKCGHVGKNYYVKKAFPVEAENGKEAAKKVRFKARVKHNHKDAILSVKKIDENRFLELRNQFKKDPYFHCKNRQEQLLWCKGLELHREAERIDFGKRKRSKTEVYYHKQKIRDYKKYLTRYLPRDDYA